MKKFKILSITLILCALGVVTYPIKAQEWQLTFDDKYFSSPNGNPTFSNNVSDIYFTYQGNDGYGLFLLGTGTATKTKLTMNGNEITCNKQINGYLTTNFTDFGMFPLDEVTANKIQDIGINYITGGLYYECTGVNNSLRTGVYGYIKWTYGEDGENVQEIRAGLKKNSRDVYEWATTSPIELVYSTNFRNNNRSLSGIFLSNLTNQSTVIPRFTRDVGILNNILTGTNTNSYYIVDATQYLNAGMTIYAKTEQPGHQLQFMLTGFDTDGQSIYNTGIALTTAAEDSPVLYGYYGYSTWHIPYITGMESGDITLKYANNSLKTIGFTMSGSENTENFNIIYTPESNMCATSKKATITGINNPNIYSYKRGSDDRSSGAYEKEFTNERSGQVLIQLTNGSIVSIDVNIENVDNEPPVFNQVTYDPTTIVPNNIPQCVVGYVIVSAQDTGCGKDQITISRTLTRGAKSGPTNSDPGIGTVRDTLPTEPGEITYNYTATDGLGNESSLPITFNVIDEPVTGHDFKRSLRTTNDGGYRYTADGNWKILSNAHAGDCEQDNINATPGTCAHGGTLTIAGDTFTYRGNTDYDECNVDITDTNNSITVIGAFYDCSLHEEECKPHLYPEIIAGDNYIDYKYLGFEDSTLKYTSGVQVIVKLNAEGISDIASYRASCIKQQEYCKKLIDWEPECNEGIEFCTNLARFKHEWERLGHNIQVCDLSQKGWSNRINYPSTDEFPRNIEASSGCEYVEAVPYGSRDQGQRKVWIQIMDDEGHKSDITETIIPVNYTTQSPTLQGTYEKTYEDITYYGMYQVVEEKNTLQYANQTSFTTTVKANGATLNNGEIGLNYEHRDEISSYGILRRPESPFQKLLYFDDLNEWIISVFGRQ